MKFGSIGVAGLLLILLSGCASTGTAIEPITTPSIEEQESIVEPDGSYTDPPEHPRSMFPEEDLRTCFDVNYIREQYDLQLSLYLNGQYNSLEIVNRVNLLKSNVTQEMRNFSFRAITPLLADALMQDSYRVDSLGVMYENFDRISTFCNNNFMDMDRSF